MKKTGHYQENISDSWGGYDVEETIYYGNEYILNEKWRKKLINTQDI